MSAFSDDSTDPEELRKYVPKWARERPATPNAERLRQVSSASTVPSSEEENQNRSISPLWPRPVPEPPAEREHGLLAWVGQAALVAVVATVVASLAIFGKPLLQRVGLLEPDSPPIQVSKPADPRLTANDAPANRPVPAAGVAAAPVAAS